MNSSQASLVDHIMEKLFHNQEHLEYNREGLLRMNEKLKVTYWCSNMERLTGIHKEDILNRDLFESKFSHLFNRKEIFEKVLENNTSLSFAQKNRITGSWFKVSVFPFQKNLMVTIRNITSEREKEREIRTLKNLKRYVLNSTSDIIWAIDSEFQLLLANESYYKKMKFSTGKDITIGNNVFQHQLSKDLNDSRKKMWLKTYRDALQGNSTVTTFSISHGSDKQIYHVKVDPILSVDDKVSREIIGVACFGRDITEQRKHEKEIEQQNKKLKDIAWLQSHKIRSPLANILGIVNLLKNASSVEEKSELINLLSDSARELDEIVLAVSEKTR